MKQAKWMSSLLVAGVVWMTAAGAQAHVNVYPKETTTGAYEKYTVRVPVEKDANTVKVKVEFPAGVKVSTVQPVPGWSYEFEKDAEGRNTALIWTATDGGIGPHEFVEFAFVGANPKEAGELSWKAYQTYTDGEVVEWTGDQDSKTPASVTAVRQGAGDAGHGHDHGHADEQPAPAAAQGGSTGTGNTLPLVLSGLALLLSLVSFFRKKA